MLITGEVVTANYFDVLGIRPAVGRAFREDENAVPGAAPVVVLSHGLWQRRLGGRTNVVGETIELSGLGYTIVGVAPPGFTGTVPGIPSEFWVPLMMVDRLQFSGVQTPPTTTPARRASSAAARAGCFSRAGSPTAERVDEARAQIETIFARLRTDYPVTNEEVTASVLPAASIRFHPMLDGYVKAASAVAAGRGRPGAADRVRQRRQHAARARRVAPPRVGDPRRDRRQPRAARPAAAERRPRAGGSPAAASAC